MVDASVSPFAQHGLDEPFCFPVCLRPVRASADVADFEAGAVLGPGLRDVGRSVVGHDAFNCDAALREPRDCPIEEPDRCEGLLVRENFDVGAAAGVIDTDVDGFPTNFVVVVARSAASDSVPWLVETAQSFDVDVDLS